MVTVDVLVYIQRLDLRLIHRKAIYDLSLADTNGEQRIITLTTTEETVTLLSDVNDKGFLYLENLSDETIDVGYVTGVYPKRLRPRTAELAQLASGTSQLFVRAQSGTPLLLYALTEAPI